MNVNNKNNTPFKAEDVNWEELAGIGILKDELEMSGELDTLLKGEKTRVMSLSLVLLGVDVVMDATLQLVRKDGDPLLAILGNKSVGEYLHLYNYVNRMYNRRFPSLRTPASGKRLNSYPNHDSNHSRETECRSGHSPRSRGYRKNGRLHNRKRLHGDMGAGTFSVAGIVGNIRLHEELRR